MSDNRTQILLDNLRKNLGYPQDENEVWLDLSRLEMIKKYIEIDRTFFHPRWDEYLIFRMENDIAEKPDFATKFATKIEKTTVGEFFEWFYFRSGVFQYYFHETFYFEENLYLLTNSDKNFTFSIVSQNSKPIQFFEGICINGWEYKDRIFVDDVAVYYNEARNYGLVKSNGEFIENTCYDWISNILIDNNIVLFMQNRKYGFMRLTGEIVIPAKFDKIYGIEIGENNFDYITYEIEGKEGLMDFSLNEIFPCLYKSIIVVNEECGFDKKDEVFLVTTFDDKKEKYAFRNNLLVKLEEK